MPLSSKYGSKVCSPTLKLPVSLPPPSINIVFLEGVCSKMLSPCPTSIKFIVVYPVGN